jgi:parallel beta-helix repeat protein
MKTLDVISFLLLVSTFAVAMPALAATVIIPVGSSIQSAIQINPPGTTYQLPAGTWHQQHIVPRTGDQYIGDPGGGTVLSGDDVTADLVTDGAGSNVTLTNLTLTHYTGFVIHGAHTGWIYNNITSTYNYGGLYLYAGARVNGGHFNYNKHSGLNNCCNSGPVVVDGAEVGFNNSNHDDPNDDAAGIKMEAENITIKNSNIHDNYGVGVWCDVNCSNWTIAYNNVSNNLGNGIMYEVSYGCAIYGNTVRGSGSSGIYISNSQGCDVHDNKIEVPNRPNEISTGAFGGVVAIYDNRPPLRGFRPPYRGNYNTTHNSFHDNIIIFAGTAGCTGYCYDYNPLIGGSFTNTFARNTYYVPNLTTAFWKYDNTPYLFSGWQSLGQDTDGQAIVGVPGQP